MTLPTFSADAIRAWLAARYDEDEQSADQLGEMVGLKTGFESRWRRDVEAKRRRLARHAPEPWRPGWPGHVCHDFELINVPDGWTGPLTHWCDWCSETQSREEWFYTPWPCPDVIDDAQSYRDAPDFPAELRLP